MFDSIIIIFENITIPVLYFLVSKNYVPMFWVYITVQAHFQVLQYIQSSFSLISTGITPLNIILLVLMFQVLPNQYNVLSIKVVKLYINGLAALVLQYCHTYITALDNTVLI